MKRLKIVRLDLLFPTLGVAGAGLIFFITSLINWPLAVIMFTATVALILAVKFTEQSFYLVVLLYPFINWQFVWGSINVPWGDLAVMVVFFAWIGKFFFANYFQPKKLSLKCFPGWWIFGLFVLASGLSLINADNFWFSLKYLARPLVFFYLMYIVLPYNIIDSRAKMNNVWRIFYWLGMFIAAMGLWSLIFPPWPFVGWRRAVPLSIFGVYPLGYNHNLLAEVLVVAIPVTFYLLERTRGQLNRKLMILSLGLMTLINLMTFSRAGWLTLFGEILVFIALIYRRYLMKVLGYSLVVITIILPALIAMYVFNTSTIASNSNINRWMMTEIAWENWQRHPLIGNGVGSFESLLWQNRFYILEYGSAIDAHGFIQKILAESGILGLTAFSLFLGYVFYRLIRGYRILDNPADKELMTVCLVITGGLVVMELFQTSYFVGKLWLPVGMTLATVNLLTSGKSEHQT